MIKVVRLCNGKRKSLSTDYGIAYNPYQDMRCAVGEFFVFTDLMSATAFIAENARVTAPCEFWRVSTSTPRLLPYIPSYWCDFDTFWQELYGGVISGIDRYVGFIVPPPGTRTVKRLRLDALVGVVYRNYGSPKVIGRYIDLPTNHYILEEDQW